ncbi:hypothetical protein VCG_002480 [Vibrio cholerae 12129(1)]|nr:hypothetical protein VCG_002480 [Vibrio cholerae 12129(1)]
MVKSVNLRLILFTTVDKKWFMPSRGQADKSEKNGSGFNTT